MVSKYVFHSNCVPLPGWDIFQTISTSSCENLNFPSHLRTNFTNPCSSISSLFERKLATNRFARNFRSLPWGANRAKFFWLSKFLNDRHWPENLPSLLYDLKKGQGDHDRAFESKIINKSDLRRWPGHGRLSLFSHQGHILCGFAAICFDLTHVCLSGVL